MCICCCSTCVTHDPGSVLYSCTIFNFRVICLRLVQLLRFLCYFLVCLLRSFASVAVLRDCYSFVQMLWSFAFFFCQVQVLSCAFIFVLCSCCCPVQPFFSGAFIFFFVLRSYQTSSHISLFSASITVLGSWTLHISMSYTSVTALCSCNGPLHVLLSCPAGTLSPSATFFVYS